MLLPPHLISIVGAGPGDPELLTVKALRRIEHADIILYDALHGEEILEQARPEPLKSIPGNVTGTDSTSQSVRIKLTIN